MLDVKKYVTMLSLCGSLATASNVDAQAGTPKKVFGCSLGKKIVSVSAVGNRLTYQFGTPAKIEMTIIASAAQGNVFYRMDRYASMEYQLRFVNGPYSYIVYSMGASQRAGSNDVSGLTVMKGKQEIASMNCTRFSELNLPFAYDQLPEDSEEYSAM